MTLGAAIREIRRRANCSQEQAALFAGVDQSRISAWEHDRAAPSIAQLTDLEDGLKTHRGTALRLAGLVTDPVTPEEVIANDPLLDDRGRRNVLSSLTVERAYVTEQSAGRP